MILTRCVWIFGSRILPVPDDPLAPCGDVFGEPWQATVLALADAMIRAGHFTAVEWADALGNELQDAEAGGAPDDETTYYTAALSALEKMSEPTGIGPGGSRSSQIGMGRGVSSDAAWRPGGFGVGRFKRGRRSAVESDSDARPRSSPCGS